MKKFLFGILGLLFAVPAVADTSGAISSVTVAGLVAQNGTPTPTTPIDIVSNNGVVKYGYKSVNMFDKNTALAEGTMWGSTGVEIQNPNYYGSNIMPVIGGHTYTRTTGSGSDNIFKLKDGTTRLITSTSATITAPENAVNWRYNYQNSVDRNAVMVVEGTSLPDEYVPYGGYGLYVDGTAETITDSANHTATVATLLGVGDYRDTQNINTGAITRNVGVKVFNGRENWSLWRNGYTTMVLRGIARARTVPLSNITESVSSKIELDGSADLNFYNIVTDFPTVTDWKRYIADQYNAGTPVIVIYPLATETTESVAGQTMTTAPVNNRTGGVTGMTITTLLSSGASVVTTIAADAIKIATTAYNSARFSPVVTELNNTIATIRSVVTNTINQTKAIADLQATKQTRPNENCPAGKKCLLVETEENGVIVPHWYEIVESPEVQ